MQENTEFSVDDSPIKKIGSIYETDSEGYIKNQASRKLVPDKWWPLINETSDAYEEHCDDSLHTVYLYGSVPRGLAIDEVSDLNTIGILDVAKETKEQMDFSWIAEVKTKLQTAYPFARSVNMLPLHNRLHGIRVLHIKTEAICIYGKDIADKFDSFRFNKDTARRLRAPIARRITQAKEMMRRTKASNTNPVTWIYTRLVRHGLFLVGWKAGKYTRDLYPCYKLFSKHYPKKEPQMRQALLYAIDPKQADKDRALRFLDTFGEWIVDEDERIFGGAKT